VPQQVHVVNRVGAGEHASNQPGHLQPGRVPRPARHRQMITGQLAQPSALRQPDHRHQPRRRRQRPIIEPRGPNRGDVR
jgi:hypothetical protein